MRLGTPGGGFRRASFLPLAQQGTEPLVPEEPRCWWRAQRADMRGSDAVHEVLHQLPCDRGSPGVGGCLLDIRGSWCLRVIMGTRSMTLGTRATMRLIPLRIAGIECRQMHRDFGASLSPSLPGAMSPLGARDRSRRKLVTRIRIDAAVGSCGAGLLCPRRKSCEPIPKTAHCGYRFGWRKRMNFRGKRRLRNSTDSRQSSGAGFLVSRRRGCSSNP